MFKKLLAMAGIGAARVDARLQDNTVMPGEMLQGEVHIRGGDVAQEVDSVYLYLVTEYKREVNDMNVTEQFVLAQQRLTERFTVAPSEDRAFPFTLHVPYETPLSMGYQKVYVKTGLSIASAADPEDKDAIQVQPHPLMLGVFSALEELGFHLYQAQTEYAPRFGRHIPFAQEFEFSPGNRYHNILEELEVIFALREGELEVLMELDRRKRGLMGFLESAYELNERYTRFQITSADLDRGDLPSRIDGIIRGRLQTA
jgi:sporulation-control protein